MKSVRKYVCWSMLIIGSVLTAACQPGDEDVGSISQALTNIEAANDVLAADVGIVIDSVEYFTIGGGRPTDRILQGDSRWVPYDPRRVAQNADLTYLVDQSDGATTSGLSNAQTEAAIDAAMTTWSKDKCLKKVPVIKNTDWGLDPDIFDGVLGMGGMGNPFLADIVFGGWMPPDFFFALDPVDGDRILAVSVSYIFIYYPDYENNPYYYLPTDINGDNYMDRALNEVYFNDAWGMDLDQYHLDHPWNVGKAALPDIDVETVALHESGHSFGVGHFGPPPSAVMNPIYAGPLTKPKPVDSAGMCAMYGSWPNP